MKFCLSHIFFLVIAKSMIAQTVSTVSGIQGKTGLSNGTSALTTFNNPHGVEVDKQGNIYIADRYNHCIRKTDANGTTTTFAGSGISGNADGQGTQASFKEPWGVTVDTLGNVFVADTKNNKIRKITPSGFVTTIAGTGAFGITDSSNPLLASFGNPTGIAIDKSGTIYVCDHLTHLIRKIAPSGAVTTLAGNKNYPDNYGLTDGVGTAAKFYRPYGIETDQKGNLYVADEWNHAIRLINASGKVTTIAGNGKAGNIDSTGSTASFNFPWDVAVDTSGNVYVADGLNYVIRKIDKQQRVTTFAGIKEKTGATDGKANEATFNGATSLSLNSTAGYLIVGDAYNQLIRKISFTPWVKEPQITIDQYFTDSLSLCAGKYASLAFAGGYDFYDILINENLVFTTSQPNINLPLLNPGNYLIKAKGYKAGFTAAFSNVIKLAIKPTTPFHFTITPLKNLCVGDTVTLATSYKNTVQLNTGETGNTFKIYDSGKFYITATDGCFSNQDTLSLFFNPLPNVIVSGSSKNPLFIGDSVPLKAAGAKTYKWSNQETCNPIYATHSGSYYALGTDSLGCSSTSNSVTLNFLKVPNLEINYPEGNSFCSGSSVTISANVGKNIQWLKEGQPIGKTDSLLTINTPGLYSFQYEFINGTAFVSNPVYISEDELPDANFTFTTSEEMIGKTTIVFSATSLENNLFTWIINNETLTSNQNNLPYAFTKEGEYIISLSVENEFGCAATVSKTILASVKTALFIPTGFTPNGDGVNDELQIKGISPDDNIHLLIFNEWGEQVFTSNSVNHSWNGMYKGDPANAGNYTYYLELNSENGISTHTGIITLIR